MGDPRTFWVEDPVEDDDDEVEQPWEPDDPEYRNAASYVQKVVFCTHICKRTARECGWRSEEKARGGALA